MVQSRLRSLATLNPFAHCITHRLSCRCSHPLHKSSVEFEHRSTFCSKKPSDILSVSICWRNYCCTGDLPAVPIEIRHHAPFASMLVGEVSMAYKGKGGEPPLADIRSVRCWAVILPSLLAPALCSTRRRFVELDLEGRPASRRPSVGRRAQGGSRQRAQRSSCAAGRLDAAEHGGTPPRWSLGDPRPTCRSLNGRLRVDRACRRARARQGTLRSSALTRPALVGGSEGSGRRASLEDRRACGASNTGLGLKRDGAGDEDRGPLVGGGRPPFHSPLRSGGG